MSFPHFSTSFISGKLVEKLSTAFSTVDKCGKNKKLTVF